MILRRLRTAAERGELTKAMGESARQNLRQTIALLHQLEREGITIANVTQLHIDAYLASIPKHMPSTLSTFSGWLNRTGINTSIRIENLKPSIPEVAMSDTDRWSHVHTLLHNDSIKLYARIAGLFMLLFAQSLTGICRMRATQVDARADGPVRVTFHTTPVEMPEPLGSLIREQPAHRGQASYVARDNGWLFPGGIPGQPLATENVRSHLAGMGIRSKRVRHAALFALSAEIPHMILAETLGISQTAATTWGALAARDWGSYIRDRGESEPLTPSAHGAALASRVRPPPRTPR